MPDITYLIGDATAPRSPGNRIICHVCNDIGGWGKGFVVAISKRWPQPEADFRRWYAGRDHNDFALGAVRLIQVEPALWVANLIGQHGLRRPRLAATRRASAAPPAGERGVRRSTSSPLTPPVRYDAIESGLAKLATEAAKLNASVHMPRIGCGLAGGTWDQIDPLIRRTLCQAGVPVVVYDLGPT